MDFEWDENKNQINIQKHGVSFEAARGIFSGEIFTREDRSIDYNEVRLTSIGEINGCVVLVVAHTDRFGSIRIISARKALPKERRSYYEYLKRRT